MEQQRNWTGIQFQQVLETLPESFQAVSGQLISMGPTCLERILLQWKKLLCFCGIVKLEGIMND